MQFFAREDKGAFACFDLVINKLMLGPFSFAGTIPEIDFISAILS